MRSITQARPTVDPVPAQASFPSEPDGPVRRFMLGRMTAAVWHAELVDIRREPSGKVLATLTYDEAVVLFELLGRWESRAVLDDKELWSDRAERQVLWDLHAELEPIIDEAFLPSYSEVVRAAWAAVRGPENP